MTMPYDMPERCPWLVQVPSGNPEPSCPEDLWTLVECGELVRPDPPDGAVCDAGHYFGNLERHLGEGGTEWQREQEERFRVLHGEPEAW